MPPKTAGKEPKKTKKQLKEEAEAERLKLAEIEERERLEREERERQEYEAKAVERQTKIAEVMETLKAEEGEEEGARANREAAVMDLTHQQQLIVEWVAALNPTRLPKVTDEAELNSFIAEMYEEQATLPELVQKCSDELAVIRDLQLQQALSGGAGCIDYEHYRATIFHVQFSLIDKFTKTLLMHREAHTTVVDSKHEMQLSAEASGIRYGLWVNIAKNLLLRTIDYPDLGLSTSVPRPIITNSVALRVLHCEEDPYPANGSYFTVGGVLFIQIVDMPKLPIKVKSWSVLQLSAGHESISKIEYGAVDPVTGIREKVPHMHVSLRLPPTVVLPTDKPPKVGRWDTVTEAWTEDDITEPSIEEKEGEDGQKSLVVSFQTRQLGALAVLQGVDAFLPFRGWRVHPLSPTRCLVTVECQTIALKIEVTEAGCRLLPGSLLSDSLSDFREPPALLYTLRRHGIQVCPVHAHAEQLSLRTKSREAERDAAYGISLAAPGLVFASSPLNKQVDADTVVVRARPFDAYLPDDDPALSPEDGGWATMVLRQGGEPRFGITDDLRCCFVLPPPEPPATPTDGAGGEGEQEAKPEGQGEGDGEITERNGEEAPKSDLDRLKEVDILGGVEFKRYCHTLAATMPSAPQAQERIQESNTLLLTHLHKLLSVLRLWSFEPEPEVEPVEPEPVEGDAATEGGSLPPGTTPRDGTGSAKPSRPASTKSRSPEQTPRSARDDAKAPVADQEKTSALPAAAVENTPADKAAPAPAES